MKNDRSPKELLNELKRSLSEGASEKTQPDPDDGRVVLGQAAEEDNQGQSKSGQRYRFTVRRPTKESNGSDEQPEEKPEEQLAAKISAADTRVDFARAEAPDIAGAMKDILTPEEMTALGRIGRMQTADEIAEQARAEVEAEYAEREQDDKHAESDGDAQEQDDGLDGFIPAPNVTNKGAANALNYVASLTKQAAAAAAGEREAEGLAGDIAARAAKAAQFAMNSAKSENHSADTRTDEQSPDYVGQASAEATEEPVYDVQDAPDADEMPQERNEVTGDGASDEYDDVDVNLMMAFGMEDKLRDAVGEKEAELLTARADEEAKTMTSTDIFAAVGADDKPVTEFTDFSQAKDIHANYARKYRKTLLSLMASAVLTLILFFFENVGRPSALDSATYPLVNLMFGLQLLVFEFALCFDIIKRGFASALTGKWIPESALTAVAAMSVLYQILLSIFGRSSFTTYDFPAALCCTLALLCEFLNCRREMYSFNVTASKKVKYALCAMPHDDAQGEQDAFREFYEKPQESAPTEDTLSDDFTEHDGSTHAELGDVFEDRPIYRLRRGGFIDGFYEKIAAYPACKMILRLLIPAAVCMSLLFALIGGLRMQSLSYGLSMGFFSLIMCAPMSCFITYSYPFYRACAAAFRSESAIIGEGAIEDYLDAEEITFEDKDIFEGKAVKVKSIKVYGNHRIDRVVFYAANLFRKYGGPLASVFNMATLELGTTDEVLFGEVADNGIEAIVAGTHVYVGKTDYLRDKGYAPAYDEEDEVIEGNGGICVMFLAVEDEIAAKFYIEYTIDNELDSILRALYSAGVCIGIRTFDPNIDDAMLSRLLRYDRCPVRVIKCRTEQPENLAREHLDSAIISRRSVKDMLRAFMSCDRTLRTIRVGAALSVASMAVSAVVALIVIFFTGTTVAGVWAALFQLFWLLPVALVAKLTVR